MPYDSLITRSDAQALVPEQVSADLLKGLTNMSAAMSMFRRIPMSTNQTRMPIISALPTAYFVNGDTGLKQTTEMAWSNKYLDVEELAVIVPIPDAVLDDASYDVWGSIRPLLEEAVARALDAAIFFGTNKPSSWPTAIITAAASASNTVTKGTNAAAAGGIAGDISDLLGKLEADGFDADHIIANRIYRGRLRQVRATTGEQLAEVTSLTSQVNVDGAFGVPISYPMRGMWPAVSTGNVELIAGDFSNGILGTRQDFTYKILDQAVIQAADGSILYNLAQQDMVAMRLVFRCAFQVANIINYDQQTEASRYPFATLLEP